MDVIRQTAALAVVIGGIAAATCTLYLLVLLAVAALGRRRSRPGRIDGALLPTVALLIPAHDEEAGLGATLAGVGRLTYPAGRLRVVVIADNCTDGTAAVARNAGVEVIERHDPRRRGKGRALAFGIAHVLGDPAIDAITVLDADCEPSPNLIEALACALLRGASAAQAAYVVSNPAASATAALRYAAFALMNTVRPLAKERLRLSAGLLGTGMAFRRATLERTPWDAFSVAEDGEYHARLVLGGGRVAFVPDAQVRSAMPETVRQARSQQERWETGKVELIRRWAVPLLRAGLQHRDPVRLHAGLELLVPPQTLLLAANVVLLLGAVVSQSTAALTVAIACAAGQTVYVAGGLWVTHAPPVVYRSLLFAPVLVLWKVALFGRVVAGRGARNWVRTGRV